MSKRASKIIARHTDSNGVFPTSSLGTIMRELGETPTRSEILDAIGKLSDRDTGEINASEFMGYYLRRSKGHRGAKLNRLLLKDPLGRQRRSGYNLPKKSHVFGKTVPRDPEGAGAVVLSWKQYTPSPDKSKHKDLVTMNKLATIRGCSNSGAVREFFKDNEVIVSNERPRTKGRKNIPKHARSLTFGQRTRPSTPIHKLIKNGFAESDYTELDYPRIDRRAKPRPEVRTTKASQGQNVRRSSRYKTSNSTERSPFKLKKFLKVRPRVSSYNGCGGGMSPTERASLSPAPETL